MSVDNGVELPINIDLNYSGNSQQLSLVYSGYNWDNIIISGNYYDTDVGCLTGLTELCDIGLTGTDNGLVSGMTGFSIYYTNELLDDSDKWDRYKFDRRFKAHQVTGFSGNNISKFSGSSTPVQFGIQSKQHSKYGYYEELYGGFYQGFYKLYGYNYEIFPQRVNKGWSVELLIKPRVSDEFPTLSGYTTLNELYPENKGILFYFGSRAENKYYHPYSGSPESNPDYTRITSDLECIKTCGCIQSGTSDCYNVYPPSNLNETIIVSCDGSQTKTIKEIIEVDPKLDSMSNGFAIKLSGDTNPKIGFRSLLFYDYCTVSGDCDNSGYTYNTGYTIDERYSDKGIFDHCLSGDSGNSGYTDNEHWLQIGVVWERYNYYDECELLSNGGVYSIINEYYTDTLLNTSVNLIKPPITNGEVIPSEVTLIQLNEKWLNEIDYRMGRLKIYINGRLFHIFENVEEVIPRPLNTEKEKQIGVPYNISIGGGTQGLYNHLIFSGCPTDINNINYTQDPELFSNYILDNTSFSGMNTDILLDKYFAGTFDGAISQFRMYSIPLSSDGIKHNFKLNKDKFNMYDPDCPDCNSCYVNDFEFTTFFV